MSISSDQYLPYKPPYEARFSFGSFSDRSLLLNPDQYWENPSRSENLYRELNQVVRVPVAGVGLSVTCDFVLSSAEGDEFGIAITPNPAVSMPTRSMNRVIRQVSDLLSGFSLDQYWEICWRMLAWGDAFASVPVVDGVFRPVLLPTWQIWLEVDDVTGELVRVYQLRPGDRERGIALETFVQWSYRHSFVYGKSLFYELRESGDAYDRNSADLRVSSRDSAITPNIHIMPEGTDSQYLQAYKTDHQHQQRQGPIGDFYLSHGAVVQKPYGAVAQFPLNGMLSAIEFRRKEIAVGTRVPLYLLGIDYRSAREISLQPAMTFRLHIGRIRSILASQLMRIVNRELGIKGVSPYRLVFPRIDLNPFEQIAHNDLDAEGVLDVDG